MGDYDPFMKPMQEVSFRQGWSILRQIRPSVVRFVGRIEVVVGGDLTGSSSSHNPEYLFVESSILLLKNLSFKYLCFAWEEMPV